MTPPRTTKASSPAAALPLLLIVLIDSMGFAMLTPLLAAELAPDSTAAIGAGLSEDARYIIYGVATGLYPMMMFFGAPILGQLSDRIGRKRMLLVCAVGIVFSYTILSIAFALGSVILVMAGRALGGMTAASQPISLAALVDVSAPEKRDFWLSMGLLASSVGFVVGPALSGLLSDSSIMPWFNTQTPLLATVALAALNFFLLLFLFREPPRPTSVQKRTPLSLLSGLHSLAHAFQRPGLRRVSSVFLLQEMAWGAYFFFVAHFVMDRFDASVTDASLFMAVMGIGFCISFALAMPLLTKRFSAHAITSGSLLATAAFIVVMYLCTEYDRAMGDYPSDFGCHCYLLWRADHTVHRSLDRGYQGGDHGYYRCHKRIRFWHDFFRLRRLAGDRRKNAADCLICLDVPQLGRSGGSKISRPAGGLSRIGASGGEAAGSLSSA